MDMNDLVTALDTTAEWPDDPVFQAEISSHINDPVRTEVAWDSFYQKEDIFPASGTQFVKTRDFSYRNRFQLGFSSLAISRLKASRSVGLTGQIGRRNHDE